MILQIKQLEKRLKTKQVINKKTIGTTVLILIFCWMIRDCVISRARFQELNKYGVKTFGIIKSTDHLSNRRVYTIEYLFNGIKFISKASNNRGYLTNKTGDTILIEVSSVNPTNIRCAE